MKICLLIVVAAVALTSAATIKSTNKTLSNGGISPLLSLVADVDGKSFYVDTSASRNWTTALNFCEGLGMRLASITSANQWEALTNSTIPEFPNSAYYWTGGRESQKITEFEWSHNEAELSASYITWRRRPRSYRSCVDFLKSGADSYLANEACTFENDGVLCETY